MYTVTGVNKNAAKVFGFLSDARALTSKAPALYRVLMELAGLSGTYTAFMVDSGDLEAAVQGLGALNITGANIGVPYQEQIIPHIFALSEGAKIVGAVNTIVRHGLYYKGYNTNALGLMDALGADGFKTAACKSALVVGTGGAARAAVFVFNWLGIPSMVVTGRQLKNAKKIVTHIGGGQPNLLTSLADQPITANIVVNATTVSHVDEAPDLATLIHRINLCDCQMVVDFNYDKQPNIWHELADRQGVKFMDGLPILGHQAKHMLALFWPGLKISAATVATAIKKITES
ncbi:MAG: hypothetical protein GWP07_01935 [Xanthomonadaceae bacterium]|nr:hypothetical protein [Xanthomonadaceae bacterium]